MSPLSVAVRRAALLCLPFAAVFTAGITLSPHADAQYPGGGSGYPGGGSGGSYPGAGWHPLKPDGTPPSGNDLLNTSPLFNSYDWTKLDIDIPNSPTVKYVTGEAQGSTGGVSGPVGAGTTRNIHGTSTIKYQWVPPLNAAGQPDAANFPAPPLFVLGSIGLSGGLTGSDGMSGSGSLADGWGGTLSMTLPCSVSAQGRKVLSASGSPAVFTMSPSASLRLSVTAPGQMGGGGVFLSEFAYPITLSAPNPLTNPLLGDGTNQFAYNGYAIGQLLIPAVISVPGSGTADTAWLTNGSHVDISVVGPTISGQKPYAWSAAAGSISAQTAGVDAANNAYAAGNFAFLGLPTSYNGSTGDPNSFGNHLSILKVDGTSSETAHIQTFFRSTASNWPGTDGITPNWYHYYNQVYASPGFYDPDATSSYTDPQSPPQYPIHIANDAHGPYNVRIFDINPTPPNYVRYVGYLDLAGIDHYIYTCAHETGHQVIFLSGGIYNFNADPAHTSPVSADGDNVSDAWEPNHHLNPNSSDTANAYGIQSNGDKGDNEVLADVQALPVLFQQISAWNQDWADDGLQWGPNAYTTGNPPGFYFTFHALVGGTTVVAGNPYSIRSLNDLQTQYPSLLTSLP